jgi:hypothetical protein
MSCRCGVISLASLGSSAVEQLTYFPKFKGSKRAAAGSNLKIAKRTQSGSFLILPFYINRKTNNTIMGHTYLLLIQ